MKANEGTLDRIIRAVLGAVLLYLAFTLGGTWTWIGGILGVILLGTAAVGFCPLYTIFGMNTCPAKR